MSSNWNLTSRGSVFFFISAAVSCLSGSVAAFESNHSDQFYHRPTSEYPYHQRGNFMLYKSLLWEYLKNFPLQVRDKWIADLVHISNEQWDFILDLTPKLSLSEAQRFSQLFLVHQVYKSPSLLFKIGIRADSACPRCNLDGEHLMHMFWECTVLVSGMLYWI